MIEFEELKKYVHLIDKPGLYMVKLNKSIPNEMIQKIATNLKEMISEKVEGVELVLLDSSFSPVFMPGEDVMSELGWVKKENNE